MYHGLLIQKAVKRNLVQEPVLGKTQQYTALPPAACVPSSLCPQHPPGVFCCVVFHKGF